jgi:hypothetical protein
MRTYSHKRFWNEHKLGNEPRWDSKRRTTMLARTRSNLLEWKAVSCRHERVVRQSLTGKDVSTKTEDIVGIRYQATAGEDIVN